MCWMLGEFPNLVYSMANSQIPEIAAYGDFDNLVCNLNFKSGTIGSIDISRSRSPANSSAAPSPSESRIAVTTASSNRVWNAMAAISLGCSARSKAFAKRWSLTWGGR